LRSRANQRPRSLITGESGSKVQEFGGARVATPRACACKGLFVEVNCGGQSRGLDRVRAFRGTERQLSRPCRRRQDRQFKKPMAHAFFSIEVGTSLRTKHVTSLCACWKEQRFEPVGFSSQTYDRWTYASNPATTNKVIIHRSGNFLRLVALSSRTLLV